MHRTARWFVLSFFLGALVMAAPMSVTGAPSGSTTDDPPAPAPATVEPVAGVTYADAAPLSNIGSGTRNYFGFHFTLSETYDDNVRFGQQSRPGDSYTAFSPSLVFGRLGRRTRLRVSYRPRVQIYTRFSDLNTFAHDLAIDYSYRASKRWTLSFGNRANFLPGTDSVFTNSSAGRSLDPLFGVRPVAATLRQNMFSTTNYFDVQYQRSLRSYFSVGGTYHRRHHSGQSFVNMEAASGRASYNYRYKRNSTLGVTYQYDRLWFGSGFGQSEGHALLVGHAFRVGNRVDLSLSVGPSYTIFDGQRNVPLSPLLAFLFGTPTLQLRTVDRRLSVGATGRFAYNFTNASVYLAYARSVNSGGDLFGSTRSESIRAGLTRKVSRGGTFSLAADYQTNSFGRGLNLPVTGVDRWTGEARYSHSVSDRVTMFVRYRYIQQLIANSTLDGNRQMVTLGFTFSPARGRP